MEQPPPTVSSAAPGDQFFSGLSGDHMVRQPPENVFSLLYGRCRSDGIIAVGARRPNLNGDVAVRYYLPLSVTEYQPLLPGILSSRPEWTKYIGINSLDRRALRGHELTEFQEKLSRTDGRVPLLFRKTDYNVRELTAIWCDVDVYKSPVAGLDNAAAFGVIMAKIARGQLPWPSLVAYSGRGSYYLWLLRGDDSIEPPLLTDTTAHMWRQVIDETVSRCSDLESDPTSKALSQWLKMPGTRDYKSGEEVWYMTTGAGAPGKVPIYTLPGLADFYGLLPQLPECSPSPQLPPPIPLAPRTRKKKSGRPRRGGNPGAPYRRRAEEIERLAQHRGGINEGSRTVTLLYYFYQCRAYYRMFDAIPEAHAAAAARMYHFNEKYCRPPLSRDDAKWCAPKKRNKCEVTNGSLARILRTTDEEAALLGLASIAPDKVRAAHVQAAAEKRTYLARRREVVDAALRDGRTAREIAGTYPEYAISRAFVWSRAHRIGVDPRRQEKLLLQ